MKTYHLPEEKFNEFEERILKLNKKYCSSISTKVIQKSLSKGFNGVEFTLTEFQIVGEKPLLGEYEVLAIKKIDGNHAILFGCGVSEVPKEFWDSEKTHCDHCATKRSRKNLAIIRNVKTGEILQVGKSCLKEYTHSMDDEVWKIYKTTSLYEFIENFHMENYSPCRSFEVFDTKKYLGICYHEILKYGYVSVSEANTRQDILPTKDVCRKQYQKFRENGGIPEEFLHTEKVKEIISWWLGQTNRETDPFWLNVSSVLKEGYIHLSALGLVAFLPSVYKKDMERLANLEKAYKFSPCFPSNMKVGDKVKLEVVLRKRNYYETNFSYYGGTNACYQFSDEHGYCFLWRTAPKPLLEDIDLEKETKILLSGTVKEFTEYKRTKQTVLTRCKVEAV